MVGPPSYPQVKGLIIRLYLVQQLRMLVLSFSPQAFMACKGTTLLLTGVKCASRTFAICALSPK
jgi:hypothetical protein